LGLGKTEQKSVKNEQKTKKKILWKTNKNSFRFVFFFSTYSWQNCQKLKICKIKSEQKWGKPNKNQIFFFSENSEQKSVKIEEKKDLSFLT
jgi:hypothetical protein